MLPPRRRVPVGAAALLVLAAAILLAADGAHAARGYKKIGGGISQQAWRFLASHNAARRAVGVRALAWDGGLERCARDYARARARAGCALVHSHGRYGENLFRGSGVGGGGGWTPEAVVAAWVVKERAMYDARYNACRGPRSACGHYTQIVWRGSKKVGCATATCAGGRGTFAVCMYDPPGNYAGVRPY
ncbi:hypothetical protein CFC21_089644 [Triticum aestivum]|uniref:SCP domain-containing protein n=2 Tax=Triticum aestivum TaxID=4565 RepID=A0A9R1LD31_WHEAT|nr:pathogenesis-related protein PR-1-like [Triticum aestivum]KAF7086350.1 hypothetical protein CFC21_089644 [Triticum aestivum]